MDKNKLKPPAFSWVQLHCKGRLTEKKQIGDFPQIIEDGEERGWNQKSLETWGKLQGNIELAVFPQDQEETLPAQLLVLPLSSYLRSYLQELFYYMNGEGTIHPCTFRTVYPV